MSLLFLLFFFLSLLISFRHSHPSTESVSFPLLLSFPFLPLLSDPVTSTHPPSQWVSLFFFVFLSFLFYLIPSHRPTCQTHPDSWRRSLPLLTLKSLLTMSLNRETDTPSLLFYPGQDTTQRMCLKCLYRTEV